MLANTNAITEVITLPLKARLTIQTALAATYIFMLFPSKSSTPMMQGLDSNLRGKRFGF
jgi:hypothetical protein